MRQTNCGRSQDALFPTCFHQPGLPDKQQPQPGSSCCVSRSDLPGLLSIWVGSHKPCFNPQKSRGQKQADVFVLYHAADSKKRHGGMMDVMHGRTHLRTPWVDFIEPDLTVS